MLPFSLASLTYNIPVFCMIHTSKPVEHAVIAKYCIKLSRKIISRVKKMYVGVANPT